MTTTATEPHGSWHDAKPLGLRLSEAEIVLLARRATDEELAILGTPRESWTRGVDVYVWPDGTVASVWIEGVDLPDERAATPTLTSRQRFERRLVAGYTSMREGFERALIEGPARGSA